MAGATIKFIESKVKRKLKQQVMQCHGGGKMRKGGRDIVPCKRHLKWTEAVAKTCSVRTWNKNRFKCTPRHTHTHTHPHTHIKTDTHIHVHTCSHSAKAAPIFLSLSIGTSCSDPPADKHSGVYVIWLRGRANGAYTCACFNECATLCAIRSRSGSLGLGLALALGLGPR